MPHSSTLPCRWSGTAPRRTACTVCRPLPLLDLKGVLREAKQHIPPVLERLQDPRSDLSEELRKALDADAERDGLGRGCAFCGGLGHRITSCPKILKDQARLNPANRDAMIDDGLG